MACHFHNVVLRIRSRLEARPLTPDLSKKLQSWRKGKMSGKQSIQSNQRNHNIRNNRSIQTTPNTLHQTKASEKLPSPVHHAHLSYRGGGGGDLDWAVG